MSFIAVIDQVVSALQNNAALASFCQSKWGRGLTVRKEFRKRTEINLVELPILLLTRPQVGKTPEVSGAKVPLHTVRLYMGFHQTDKTKALDEMVEFEELVDAAVMSAYRHDDQTVKMHPVQSINDEGEFHPVYSIVAEFGIRAIP